MHTDFSQWQVRGEEHTTLCSVALTALISLAVVDEWPPAPAKDDASYALQTGESATRVVYEGSSRLRFANTQATNSGPLIGGG